MASQYITVFGIVGETATELHKWLTRIPYRSRDEKQELMGHLFELLNANAPKPPIIYYNRHLDTYSPMLHVRCILEGFAHDLVTVKFGNLAFWLGHRQVKRGEIRKTLRDRRCYDEPKKLGKVLLEVALHLAGYTKRYGGDGLIVIFSDYAGWSVEDTDIRDSMMQPAGWLDLVGRPDAKVEPIPHEKPSMSVMIRLPTARRRGAGGSEEGPRKSR